MNNAETCFDVMAIGNAVVDIFARVNEEFLDTLAFQKGAMHLINTTQAQHIRRQLKPVIQCSGGSAANTSVGISSLGGRSVYVGNIADDSLGRIFLNDINAAGVLYAACIRDNSSNTDSVILSQNLSTACCLVLVTDDAQRTMGTYLGHSVLYPDNIRQDLVSNSQITYFEGYQLDNPGAESTLSKIARMVHESGNKVALSLSDPICVDRNRTEFLNLIRNHVDILFANESEIMAFCQVSTFGDALYTIKELCPIIGLTRGSSGSVVVTPSTTHTISVDPVIAPVDSTGAGDLFASGFLFALLRQKPLALCAYIGNLCAKAVLSHFGAHPKQSLSSVVDLFL